MSKQSFQNRRFILFFLSNLLLSMFINGAAAQADSSNGDWIQQSIDLTINGRFDEAESLLQSRINKYPDDLEPYFYYASLLNSKMTHYENYHNDSLFLVMIDSVINKSDRFLEKNSTDSAKIAQVYFYKGSAVGYLAFYQGQIAKWLAAFNNGVNAIDYLEQAVAYDSTFYDAYLGIGVYKYWKSTKLKSLLWVPFMKDERAEGIKLIRKASDSASRSKYMGMHQLIYILLNYGDFYKAKQYADQAIERYPESQFMWWAYTHTLYKMHDNKNAIEAYKHLYKMLVNDENGNPSHIVTCHLRMAEVYFRMKDRDNCRKQCHLVIDAFQRGQLTDNGKKDFDKLQKLLAKCEN